MFHKARFFTEDEYRQIACCEAEVQRYVATGMPGTVVEVDPTRRDTRIMVCRHCGAVVELLGVFIPINIYGNPGFVHTGVLEIDERPLA